MARKRTAATLNLLTVKEVQSACDGDHTDGGGLLLRVRGESASWVLRYTALSGRRREMGLGIARRTASQVADSLTGARELAQEARADAGVGRVPVEARSERGRVRVQGRVTVHAIAGPEATGP